MVAKALPEPGTLRRLAFPPFVAETLLVSTRCSSPAMASDWRLRIVLTVERTLPKGALRAVEFVADAAPGWYDMQDLLGI